MESVRRRIAWAAAGCLLAAAALVARLWHWQVRAAPALVREAVAQRMVALPLAARGQIRDRHGQPLTDPQPRWAVAAFPPLVQDRGAAAAALAPVLGPEAAARLLDPGGHARWLARGLDAQVAAQVAALGLPGVVAVRQDERYGPGALARHLVGYVNVAGGQLGLEATYERLLAGTAGPHLAAFRDGHGQPLAGLGVREVEVEAGKEPWDLYLTLDARLQAAVEAALDGYTPPPDAAGPPDGDAAAPVPGQGPGGPPLRAAVVVLDPASGDILAMASRPNFDPTQGPPAEGGQWAPLLNRAVAAFPPGSTFKPLVAAYALAQGAIRPDERIFCPGHYDLGDARFHDYVPGGHGWVDMRQALAVSCNIYFIRLGYERLGREGLLAAARAFGLGEPTGLNLWGEAAGALPAAQYPGEVAQLAFGQGLTATPLQMARAYAALLRGGELPPLGLVARVAAPSGEVLVRPARTPARQAVPAPAATAVAGMLAAVTEPGGSGTGQAAWVPGAGSAGKSGSAQWGPGPAHAWFIGWVPLASPRYVIAVFVEEGSLGGRVAGPLFRAVAERILAVP